MRLEHSHTVCSTTADLPLSQMVGYKHHAMLVDMWYILRLKDRRSLDYMQHKECTETIKSSQILNDVMPKNVEKQETSGVQTFGQSQLPFFALKAMTAG